MSEDEKRRDTREPVTLFVEYEGADDLVGDFTENLSSGGTFVATNRELPVGTRVHLVLSFPGLLEPISVEGTVRWTRTEGEEGEAGAGVPVGWGRPPAAAVAETFDLPPNGARHHLDKLVDHGLLVATFARPDGRGGPGAGRPAKHYSRADTELEISVPARDYQLVAAVLATDTQAQ